MGSDWYTYLDAEPWVTNGGDDRVWEEIRGVRVEKKRTVYDCFVAMSVQRRLSEHLDANPLGDSFIGMVYEWAAVGCKRNPDVSFVSHRTWPRTKPLPRVDWWSVAPDLVVEVVGPYDLTHSSLAKVQECFAAGVRQVWLVFSNVEQVYVYTAPATVRILNRADTLTADDVLPGFAVPVADLFPPAEPPTPTA